MIFIMFFTLFFHGTEPFKAINEMFTAPSYLLTWVSFVCGAVWFILAFREGKVIRKEIITKRKEGDLKSQR